MSAFDWRAEPLQCSEFREPEPVKQYPQLAYYWRRKAGLTGTRKNPDRHWRDACTPEIHQHKEKS